MVIGRSCGSMISWPFALATASPPHQQIDEFTRDEVLVAFDILLVHAQSGGDPEKPLELA